jgi:hypothetical protein
MNNIYRKFEAYNLVLICGCAHTGTSILGRILESNPDVYMPKIETNIFKLNNYLQLEKNLEKYLHICKKNVKYFFVEKTPSHIFHIDFVRRILPHAKFVITIRHPLDVIASFYKRYADIQHSVSKWRIESLATVSQFGTNNTYFFSYEEFIGNQKENVENLCEFLCLHYDDKMLNYHEMPQLWFGAKNINKTDGGDGQNHLNLRNWQINQPIFDGRGKWREVLVGPIFQQVLDCLKPVDYELINKLGYEINHID